MASTQRVALTETLTYTNGSGVVVPITDTLVSITTQSGAAATVYNALSGGSIVTSVVTDSSGNLNGSTYNYFVNEGSYIIQVPASDDYGAFNVYYEAVHGAGVGNLASSVGVLTGDVSGTLPATEVNYVLDGQTPISASTALGGVLGGTLPNPTFSSTALQSQLFPGAIVETACPLAQSGFLMCFGQAVSRTTYANLLANITTTQSASFSSGVKSITLTNTNLETFIEGVTGTTSVSGAVTFSPGMPISGSGIATGTLVTEFNFSGGDTILTLSIATTATESNTTLLFAPFGVGDGSTTFNVPDKRGRGGIGAGTGTATRASAWTLGTIPSSGAGGEESTILTAAQNGYHNHGFNVTSGDDSAFPHTHDVYNNPGETGWAVPLFSILSFQPVEYQSGSVHYASTYTYPTSDATQEDLGSIQYFDIDSGTQSQYHTHGVTGSTDYGGSTNPPSPHNTMQSVAVVNYMIKY